MKVLVVTSEPITAQQLRDALPHDANTENAEIMVLAPALQQSPLKFWLSDADEAIARAEQVRAETVEQLSEEGVQAAGTTGEADPMLAIQDALNRFPAERIVLFTHGSDGQAYREGVEGSEIEERFGIPVSHAVAG